jgi:rSAM/selenodomain-associated transferase 2
MASLAVIVPVLTDSDALAQLLADIGSAQDVELVVVDGRVEGVVDGRADGRRDPALAALAARRRDLTVIQAPAGRGTQMNAGAGATSAPVLLFLHADSRLPAGWAEAIAALPPDCVGGWFRFALDDPSWQARLIERLVAWRVRLFRLPYGDQGMFVRRGTFERLGGFRPWPLMEDVDFVRRLIAAGPVQEVPLPLQTSARRWRQDGWLARSARNVAILSLYFAGVPPARLARWYAAR